MKAAEMTDESMAMISGGVTTNDCTGSGANTDCGDWDSKGDGYNGDNVVTDSTMDTCEDS